MTTAYMLYYLSPAYDSNISGAVISNNWETATKLLLKNEHEKSKDRFSYNILDTLNITISLYEEYVEFFFKEDPYGDIFIDFCNNAFGGIKYRWSYLEFKENIQALKVFITYDNDAGDDPFCSWDLVFLEFEIDPTIKQCISWDDGIHDRKIVSVEMKKEPDEIYDEDNDRVGCLYYEDFDYIKVN